MCSVRNGASNAQQPAIVFWGCDYQNTTSHTSYWVRTPQAFNYLNANLRGTKWQNLLWTLAGIDNLKATAWTCLKRFQSNLHSNIKHAIRYNCSFTAMGQAKFYIRNVKGTYISFLEFLQEIHVWKHDFKKSVYWIYNYFKKTLSDFYACLQFILYRAAQ